MLDNSFWIPMVKTPECGCSCHTSDNYVAHGDSPCCGLFNLRVSANPVVTASPASDNPPTDPPFNPAA
jgi:hypothetical protein